MFMKVWGVRGAAEFAFAWGFVKLGIWAITWGLNTPETQRPYLDPKEPTFLGFLIMNSLYKSLKR